MSNNFPFSYQKIRKLPKISNGTRFYPADTAYSNSNLFIARSQYYDTLIHQLPEGFISIYHTQFGERIFCASVLESQRWYLITILRFGDGIELRPSYRSIFIAIPNSKIISPYISNNSNFLLLQNSTNHKEFSQLDKWNTDTERIFPSSVEYPVSSRTYFPQYVSWTYFNVSLFMFTVFDNNIHTFDVAYDKNSVTYKIVPRDVQRGGYTFRSVLSSNTPHVYSIHSSIHKNTPPLNISQYPSPTANIQNKSNNINNCVSPFLINRTKSDIPTKFKLPDEIKICPNTDFHVFISPCRRNVSPPLNVDRCIIIANTDEVSIVLPSSGFFLKIPYKYNIDEYENLSKKFNPNFKINLRQNKNKETPKNKNKNFDDTNCDYVGYTQDEAYLQPASHMPLYLFENNLLLVAAPRRFITAVLIDQDDRIRASFMVPVFESNSCEDKNAESKTENNDNINENINNNENNNNDGNIKTGPIEEAEIKDKLFNFYSLNDKASHVLCETTGEIFKMQLNPAFFASRDPRFIIPILHYFIRPKKDVSFLSNNIIIRNKIENNVIQLVTEDALQTFWNCEIFNEILLLQFNTNDFCSTFRERVCSTFARTHFYKECVSLFEPYENTKDDSKNLTKINSFKPFLGARTPDHENILKGRCNSMIIDIDSNNDNNGETINSKPPLSPIVQFKRCTTDSNILRSFSKENDADYDDINDNYNNNNANNLNDDEENDSILASPPQPPPLPQPSLNITTPRTSRKNEYVYPNSLPKNKMTSKNNNSIPSQPLSYLFQDDNDISSKVPLSSVISTPTISHAYDDNGINKMSNVFPIFNFRDIESKALKLTLESLQLNDFQAFLKIILKIFNESVFFDLFQYSKKIRLACYMQFIAIKLSLSEKPFYKNVLINDKVFRKNSMSSTVKEFWSALRMVPHDIRWPELEFRMNPKNQANKNSNNSNQSSINLNQSNNWEKLKRQWWFLRSKKNILVQREICEPEDNLFNFVEQVTNKCELGFEIFQLHQNMLGFSMYQTVSNSSK